MLWFSGTILLVVLVWLMAEQLTTNVRYKRQMERRYKSTIVDFGRHGGKKPLAY